MTRRAALAGALLAAGSAGAGEVTVEAVELVPGSGGWTARVTLRHADAGWDHYADAWRLAGEGGAVIGTRTLHHPHVDEQPFTRGLDGLRIPADARAVTVQGHDKVHGWGAPLSIDLTRDAGPGWRIRR